MCFILSFESCVSTEANVTDDKQSTKTRLLDAAEKLFADNGFDEVSVRDLAAVADVNVAAVNYHFQGKENLFHEVIRRRFMGQKDTTLASLAEVMARAEERPELAAIIRAIVGSYLEGALVQDGGMRIMALITREMHSNYNTRHMVFFKEMIAPIFAAFSAAMLAARPSLRQEDVNWLIASVVGQIHHFIMRRVKCDSLDPADDTRSFMILAFPVLDAPMDEFVSAVTDHITRFSTAAVDGMHPEVTP
ncbi:MAG: TetR/AcrR family transcriptional regulator [bacterium]|nr:TetR/AcrR family transcriptional regulator [bacterium]